MSFTANLLRYSLLSTFLVIKMAFVGFQSLPANLLALDLLHSSVGGELLFDVQTGQLINNRVSESPYSAHKRVSVMWLCEKGFHIPCEQGYQSVLRQTPLHLLNLFHYSALLFEAGREDEAIHLSQKAGSARYWAFRGIDASGCECVTGTEEFCYLQRAAKIDPNDGFAGFYLGRQQALCGQWAAAYANLTTALESEILETHERHEALLGRAESAFQMGLGLEVTHRDIQAAITLQPQNPWSRLRLCSYYRVDGYYETALELCNEGLDLAPESGFAYYYRGRVWHSWGYLDNAVSDYEKALLCLPELNAARQWLEIANR